MNRPRSGRWKAWIILGIAAAAGLGLGLHFGPPWVRAGEEIEAQRQLVASRVDTLRSKRVLRPALFEPAEEGNGWGPFVAALAGVSGLGDEDLVGFPTFSRDENPQPDPARIEAAVELIRFKIDSLKHALRRPYVEPGYDYENVIGATFPEIARALKSSWILCDAAENAHARGRGDEAVDFLVITLGIADRLTVKSHVVQEVAAAEIRTRGLETLKKILSNHRLDARQLERLANALEACDPALGTDGAWMERQDLAVRLILLSLYDHPHLRTTHDEALNASLRHSFSRRSLFADCFEAQDRHLAGVRALAQRPFSERGAAAGELLASDEAPPMLHTVMQHNMGAAWRKLAKVALEYRLARVSVAVAQFHAKEGRYPRTLEELAPRDTAFDYFLTEDGAMIVSRTRDPERAGEPVGGGQGPEADGFPAWRVRRR
ncbi:MAG TPA: hypothetical protein VFS19_04345 [Planctomycetota bacterium]|nr:hypothetical protein [Planctomycetota bacterium]